MTKRWQPFMKFLREEEQGSVAILFGFMTFTLFFLAGMAVDYARITDMRSRISSAVDAASLAAGRAMLDGNLTDSEVIDLAQAYFDQNVTNARKMGTIGAPSIKINRSAGSVDIDVASNVKMTLTRLGGFNTIDIPVTSASVFKQKDIEVGMALDITGSMRNPDDSNQPKIDGLKSAFEKFAKRLIPDQKNGDQKVRIALAPYSASINLASQAATASANRSKDNCVTESNAGAATDSVAQFFVAQDGTKDTDSTEGFPRGGDAYGCPSTAITPLSDDRDSLIESVRRFTPGGWTAGHFGAQWAWNMISDKWSWGSSQPDSYDRVKEDKLLKAVVLMTDGIFNTAYHGKKSSEQAIELCSAMKAKGVVVFTVAFDTRREPADIATLKACATPGSGYSVNASNAQELEAAFENFASKLTQLRISK